MGLSVGFSAITLRIFLTRLRISSLLLVAFVALMVQTSVKMPQKKISPSILNCYMNSSLEIANPESSMLEFKNGLLRCTNLG